MAHTGQPRRLAAQLTPVHAPRPLIRMTPSPLVTDSPAATDRAGGSSTERPEYQNCFDALRLLLAASVLYSHAYFLGGFGAEGFSRFCRGQTIAASIGVLGFFGLSGFLVTLSYERCPTPWEFLRRRAWRILPGFWACLIVTAFIVAPLIGWMRHIDPATFPWTGPNSALNFVVRNSALRVNQWTVGEVLVGLPGAGSINGSLWSLFPEALCYGALCVAAVCGALRKQRILLVVLAGAFGSFHFAQRTNPALTSPDLPTLVVFTQYTPFILAFLVGSLACVFRSALSFNLRGAIFLGLLLAVTLRLGGYNLIAPIVLPLFLLQLAHSFTCRLRHDFSYGLYIYGFAAQQITAAWPLLRSSVLVFFLCSLGLSFAFAIASWFGIERRFLSRKRHA